MTTTPALLTRASRRSTCFSTSRARRRVWSSELRSASTPRTLAPRSAPIFASARSSFCSERPCTSTWAPQRANRSAAASPSPSVDPVTRIVCSSSGRTSGNLAAEPAPVETLDVGEELVQHRIARRHRLHLELARARGTVELAQLRPVGVGPRKSGVDLAHRLGVAAREDERLHLPVALRR